MRKRPYVLDDGYLRQLRSDERIVQTALDLAIVVSPGLEVALGDVVTLEIKGTDRDLLEEVSYWVHGATLPRRDEAEHGKRYVRLLESPTFAVVTTITETGDENGIIRLGARALTIDGRTYEPAYVPLRVHDEPIVEEFAVVVAPSTIVEGEPVRFTVAGVPDVSTKVTYYLAGEGGAPFPLHGRIWIGEATEEDAFAVTREDMPQGVWNVTAEVDDTPSKNGATLTVLPRTS